MMTFVLSAVVTLLLVFSAATGADPAGERGHGPDTLVAPPRDADCEDSLFVNHDGGLENGYCWAYGGTIPPYYGAFAEGYDLGAGSVECGAYWFTQTGYFYPMPIDIYVWEGGVTEPPSSVLFMSSGNMLEDVAVWPEFSQSDYEIGCEVTGEFAVGYWEDNTDTGCIYYVGVDLDGSGGHPWTNIAPDLGFPTGWQDPTVVWGFGSNRALGIGAHFRQPPSPVGSASWGAIKALFSR